MKTSTQRDYSVIMPLTLEAHQYAQGFRQHHPHPQKAKRVYLNTLAVYAVHTYLKTLGIDTQLTAGDSWQPALQALSDTADLVVKDHGKLECRPVLKGLAACQVPPEVWGDRLGYVAVELDRELREAILLGFVSAVQAEALPLNQLRPLDELLIPLSQQPVNVGNWLQGIFNVGWQALDELVMPKHLTWQFRTATMVANPVIRHKIVTIEQADQTLPVALILGIAPTETSERDIWIRVCPTDEQTHLLPDLELKVLDAAGVPVMQAQARDTEAIQLKFGGQPLEKFSVQMTLGDFEQIETFVI
jgi:hypothetical protein